MKNAQPASSSTTGLVWLRIAQLQTASLASQTQLSVRTVPQDSLPIMELALSRIALFLTVYLVLFLILSVSNVLLLTFLLQAYAV